MGAIAKRLIETAKFFASDGGCFGGVVGMESLGIRIIDVVVARHHQYFDAVALQHFKLRHHPLMAEKLAIIREVAGHKHHIGVLLKKLGDGGGEYFGAFFHHSHIGGGIFFKSATFRLHQARAQRVNIT